MSGSTQLSEAERLAAAKSTKELLGKGISLFNTKGPLKGIESLISNGLLESSPAAVRAHATYLVNSRQDMTPACVILQS